MLFFLHVGAGPKNPNKIPNLYPKSEWQEIRFDINPDVCPDILGDMRDMDGVESASFDAVYSSHNLEHLYPHEVSLALAEFFRVLKPGGHALVSCPDIQRIAAFIAQGNLCDPIYMSPAGPVSPIDILYGYRPALACGNLHMAHHTGFTVKTLQQAMGDAGFMDIKAESRGAPSFDIWAQGFKGSVGRL